MLNIAFFVAGLSCAGWVVGIAGFYLAPSSGAAIDWAKFYYATPLIIVAASAVLADAFSGRTKLIKRKLVLISVWLLSIFVPLLAFRGYLTEGIVYHSWGKAVVLNKLEYTYYALYVIVWFGLAFGSLYRGYKNKQNANKAQIRTFSIGLIASAIAGSSFNLLLPFFGNYQLIWIGPLLTSFYIFATFYSIVKHKLFDIRLTIVRSLGYGLSVIILASVYGFVIFGVAEFAFGLHFAVIIQVVLSGATGLAALLFPRLRKFFDRLTNRLFYQDAYDPQVFVGELNGALTSTIDIQKMLDQTAEIIARNFKAEYCLFGIKETDFQPQKIIGTIRKNFSASDVAFVRQITPHMHRRVIVADDLEPEYERLKNIMQANDMAALARLAPNDKKPVEGLGYIMLGQKLSGNPYTSKDVDFLDTIAKELLIAVQNGLHFEEIQLFNITLQKKVDEATRQLKTSNEKLKALDQTKDDFISMASHQL
ncbi:MAG: histidine kinase N-terminal 7TM domain-containing protein, partial [Candidatus Saccharimonadales bacterium]